MYKYLRAFTEETYSDPVYGSAIIDDDIHTYSASVVFSARF